MVKYALTLLVVLTLGVTAVGQSPLYLPSASHATTLGNSNNYYPFGSTNMRYQQIYDQQITGGASLYMFMQLRPASPYGLGDGGFTSDIEISIGPSPNSPASPSMTWAANNPKPVTVVKRQWVFMPVLKRVAPKEWFITIPFDRPMPWAGNAHMCVEVTVYGNNLNRSGNLALDAATGSNVLACRLWNSSSLTATAATGSQKNQALVMRLALSPAPVPMFTFFGTACPGSNQQSLYYTAKDAPHLGTNFTVGVAGVAGSAPLALGVGNRSTRWGALTLPFDLTPMGAKGCSLYSSVVMLIPVTPSPTGTGATQLAIPSTTALQGALLHTQWFAVDTKANTLGLITSRRGTIRIDQ